MGEFKVASLLNPTEVGLSRGRLGKAISMILVLRAIAPAEHIGNSSGALESGVQYPTRHGVQ